MKKLVLLTLWMTCFWVVTEAQNRSIQFEQTKEWKKIIKKAKKAKKLIFLDCYTSWCGPCKMLAKEVFTRDEVADFFNGNFINVQLDMEKDRDGVLLKKQFNIRAFPTLVFVDPESQEVLHRLVGAGTPEWLLAGAKAANDPQNNLSGLMKRYESGERETAFLSRYLDALASAYLMEEQGKVAGEYLNALSAEQFCSPENWKLIQRYISDPLSVPLKQVMDRREEFYALAGKEAVDKKLQGSIEGAVKELAFWRPGMKQEFNEKRNEELIRYLLTIDYESAPAGLAELYTAAYIRKGDFQGLLERMNEVMSYNLFRNGKDKVYFLNNIKALALCEDKSLLQKGIHWIDEKCSAASESFYKADLMNAKARLQTKLGDTAGAEQSKKEEEKYTKEGEAKSGGKVMRAIPMGGF